ERDLIDDAGGEIAGRGAKRSGKKKGRSTVEDAMIFIAKMSGGAVASFDTSRLSTGDKNRNRIEIHGEKGALRFNFERMKELEWYDATIEPRLQGWSVINVTRGGDGHPYAGAWWPASHVIGYEHGFINMASDIFRVLGGQKAVVPLPDFADAYETQRVLAAAVKSAKDRSPVPMSEVK
ncbi:MAG: hypothetical protein IT442_16005, partial [Phycisphaeraceae bacterium]|nr:hypothetical protein [Phycisphaeraceae bacterium]